ncbi:sulfite exporter TauE/SafE family protein [Burkholderia sp. FERM BP-3421]|jgi:uncharacterized membrane protein YfcA|uniref:sulfite exporter TauE/SafE family protein n=1 Tax=Burkholderia sp. FERM BP-3421 TaxID=1494466 RepID=UPI002361DC66|nr:sulfite exporter TauE/SafE family protein [Burkholderia sp. FERM BP-3421]WDD94594.1 sulfite exporter TauE/SafE family protein [Burkholderia sp. FERM BP-3421]
MLIALILGGVVGAVLGLTGAGGGILAVPVLVVGMGLHMQQAAPVALVAVAGSAAIGALEGFRRGLVRYRAAFLMTATGIPLTSLGVKLAHSLPQRVLLTLFALTMGVVAVRLLRQALGERRGVTRASSLCVGRVNQETGRLIWSWQTALALASTGAMTGLMTGLLGVGGGFVIVPMLRKFTHVPMHGIVATSLTVIAFVGTGAMLVALFAGVRAPLELTLWFSATTALGMAGGRWASRFLSALHVQIAFGSVLVCVALGLLVKAGLGV